MFKKAKIRHFCRFVGALFGALVSSISFLQNANALSRTCSAGQYAYLSTQCKTCPENCYCPTDGSKTGTGWTAVYCRSNSTTPLIYSNTSEGISNGSFDLYSCYTATNGTHPHSAAGSDSASDCYRSCSATDVTGAAAVSGKHYYNGTGCTATSCKGGYYLSSGKCPACTSANNTTSTQTGTESCSITNGSGTRSYTNKCNGKYTGGSSSSSGTGGASTRCTGCSSYTRTSTGTCYVSSCNTGYSKNTTSNATSCVANTYSVSYTLNGGSYGTNHPTSATYNSSFTVNNPTRVGYTFTGWTITGMDSVTHTYGSSTTTSTSISSTTATSFKNLRSTSGTVTFTAQWTASTKTCSAGEYYRASDATCQTCPTGYYCPSYSANYTYNGSDQGLTQCSGPTQYQNATGQTSCKSVSTGYYKSSNTAQAQCPEGYRSGPGASIINMCAYSCTTSDIANSATVTGYHYYNSNSYQTYDTCKAVSCATGYHIPTIDLSSTLGGLTASGSSSNETTDTFEVDFGSAGKVYGKSFCSNEPGTINVINNTNPSTVNPLPVDLGGKCYCRIHKYTDTTGDHAISAQFVFAQNKNQWSTCSSSCAGTCEYRIADTATNEIGGVAFSSASAAGCEANTYTVSFNSNSGSGGQSSSVTATYGSTMPTISTTAPTRSGYTFMGWYDNATYTSGTQYYAATGASARAWNKTSNATLYAGWKANTYTITFDMKIADARSNITATYNTSVDVGATPTRSGWTFDGWQITGMDSTTHQYSSNNSSFYNFTGTSANRSNRYYKNLRATSGTVTFTARWSKYCSGGTYYDGAETSTCKTCPANHFCPYASVNTYSNYQLDADYGIYSCPSGFTSPSGSSSAYQCTKSGTTTCAAFNSIDVGDIEHATGVQYATSGNIACTQHAEESYADTGNVTVCMPNAGPDTCNVVGITCDAGYHSEQEYTSILEDANDGSNYNDYIEYEPNGEYENSDVDYSGYDRYDKYNGEWDTWFDYGVVRGRSRCSYDDGDYGDNASDVSDDDGYNCWCKTSKFNPNGDNGSDWTLTDSDWVLAYDHGGDEGYCAEECSYVCAVGVIGDNDYNGFQGGRDNLYSSVKSYYCALDTYTITYNLNGGSNPANAPTSYNIESSAIALPIPTKSGYLFAGWYENSSFTGTAVTEITSGSTGNKEYWAKWEQCAAGTYLVNGTCVPCAIGSYSAAGATSCTPCQNGTTTSETGKSSCDVNCFNGAHATGWATTTWNQNTVSNACTISQCSQGYTLKSGDIFDETKDGIYYQFLSNDGTYQTDTTENLVNGSFSTTFDYGEIYGKSMCASSGETGAIVGNPSGSGESCWCRLDGLNFPNTISGTWISRENYTNLSDSCAHDCARACEAELKMVQIARLGTLYNQGYFTAVKPNYCEANKYTITYLDNGTGMPLTPTLYTIDTPTFNLPSPTKYGHTFDGWFTAPDFSGTAVTQITKGTTGNKTFYAKWTLDSYECGAGQYLPKNATACAPCPAGSYCPNAGTYSFSTTTDQGNNPCAKGTYQASTGQTSCTAASAGYYVSTTGATSQTKCSGATYQNSTGQSSCKACPSGYTANTTAGKTAASSCQIQCDAGEHVAVKNGQCVSTTAEGANPNWYTTASHKVNYGRLSIVNYCPNDYTISGTSATDHNEKSDCKLTVPAGSVVSGTTMPVRYVRINSTGSTSNTGSHMVEIQAFESNDGTGTNLLSGTGSSASLKKATDDSWLRSNYASGKPMTWDMGSIQNVGSIKFAMFTDGRIYHDVVISVSTDNTNWTTIWGTYELPTDVVSTSVGELIVLSGPVTQCAPGTYKSNAETISLGQTTSTCTPCPNGYPNSDVGATAITQCYSNTKSRAWTGTQVNGTTPTNCNSVTAWNACSLNACDYVAYSDANGNGDGTLKSGCATNNAACTKTPKTVTAKSGYRVDGATCPACPSAYPNSANGNTGGYTACYTTKTASCTQNCTNPDTTGCSNATCANACSCAGTTYTQYSNATGTDNGTTSGTTSETCSSVITALTAKANYYVNGTTSCPACSSANNTTSTQTCNIANGAGSQTCNGKYTGGTAGTGDASTRCSGCSSWGTCYVTSCNTGYHKNTTSNATSCVADDYTITYNLNGGDALPNGYTPVEYITSNGSNYFDTDVNFNFGADFRVVGNFNNPKASVRKVLLGNYDGTGVFNVELKADGKFRTYFKTSSTVDMASSAAMPANTIVPYDIYYDSMARYFTTNANGTSYTGTTPTYTTANAAAAHPMRFFLDFRSSPSAIAYPVSMGTTTMYQEYERVGNFIPVRNASNVCGMYDSVGETFYPSATSTAFTCPSVSTMPTSYTYGTTTTINGIPTRAHSVFAGWCENSALTSNCETTKTISATTTGNKTYYAKWTCDTGYSENAAGTACVANTYNISYNLNGGTDGATHPASATYGNAFTVNNPTHAHATFAGWAVSNMDSTTHIYDTTRTTDTSIESTTATSFKNLRATSGTVTFTAKWNCATGYTGDTCGADSHTITLNANGATGGKIKNTAITSSAQTATFTCTTASSMSLPTWNATDSATTTSIIKSDYKFLGWAETNNATSAISVTTCPSSDKIYYAVWQSKSDACTACAAGTGAICSLSVVNNVCTYATSCKTGYGNITNNGKYNPSCTPTTYTITYKDDSTTLNGLTPTSYNIESTTFNLPTPTKTGYTFAGWYTESDFSGTAVTQIAKGTTGNKTFYAKWTACGNGTYWNNGTCSACPTGYTAGAAVTSQNECLASCGAGQAVLTAGEGCKTVTGNRYQTGTHTVAYNATTPTSSDSTSPVAGKLYNCLTNYTISGTTTADHNERSDCKITCNAGTQIASENATSCTVVTGNNYVASNTVDAGNKTTTLNACPTEDGLEITNDMIEQNGITDATGVGTSTMANRVRVKQNRMIPLSAGTYKLTFGNNPSNTIVSRGFYRYTDNGKESSAIKVNNNVIISGATLTLTEPAYVRIVFQKSSASTAITPAEVIAAEPVLTKTSAYIISGTTATDHDNINDCKITCAPGTYVSESGGSCVPADGGHYTAGGTVAYGSTTPSSAIDTCNAGTYAYAGSASCSACPNWTYVSTSGAATCTACPTLTSGYSKSDSTGTGWTAYTQCVEIANASPENCAAGKLQRIPTADGSTTWASTTINTALSASAGYYVSGQTCPACSSANNTTSTQTCNIANGAGSQTCNGKYTGGTAGTGDASTQCSGCSSWGTCYVTSCNTGYHKNTTSNATSCVANTDTPYTVNHYTKNLGANTYTLNSTDNLTGTTGATITLADKKKTITGFTYSEGFAGTAASGTTKPSSGALATTTILANGTRVINLYYNRDTHTVTLTKGNGISAVTGAETYEYGATVNIDATVSSGYTWSKWTQTSGGAQVSTTKAYSFTIETSNIAYTANATANTITLNWDENGGTAISNGSCTYDGNLVLPAAAVRTGYTFTGWKLANGTVKDAGSTITNGCTNTYTGVYSGTSTSIQAQWTKNMTITTPSNHLTYNGSAQTCPGITVSDPSSGATIKYGTASGTYNNTTPHTITNAGETTVYYQVTKSGYTTTSGSYKCYMDKADCTVTLGSTSGSTAYPTTKTVTASTNSGGTLSVSSNATSIATAAINNGTVTMTPVKAGSATMTVTSAATDNYNACSASYVLTVNKGTCNLTINPTNGTITYPTTTATFTITKGTCNGTITATSSDTTKATVALNDTKTQGTITWKAAGSATITVTAAATDQYNEINKTYSATIAKGSGTTTIKDGTTTVANATSTEVAIVYPSTKTLTATCSNSATPTITSATTDVATASISSGTITLTPKKTGTSLITVTCPATSYYNQSTSVFTFKVNNGTISATVAGNSKTYNGSALTCDGGISGLNPSDATIQYATKTNNACGEYGSAKPSRTESGTTTVCYKISKTNYTTKTGEFSCTVNKATMNASLAGNTKTFNNTALTCDGGTQTGVPTGSTITYSTTNGSGYTATKPTRTDIGTTTVYYKIVNPNYNDYTASFACKVNAGTINITWANGGHGTAPTTPASCTYDSTITMPSAITATGYTFNKWNVNNKTFNAGQTSVACNYANFGVYSGNITISASWTNVPYSITYKDGSTTMSGLTPTSYNIETPTFNLPTPTKTGYTFSGWYDNSALNGTAITQIVKGSTGDKTFYAKWTTVNYTITYKDGSTTMSGLTPTSYNIETPTFNLPTPNKSGNVFVGWHTSSELTGTEVTQIIKGTTGNKTYYAKWTQCPANSYCPSDAIPQTCPDTYPNSIAGSTSINDCYLTLTKGKYVATAGKGMTNCAANYYSDNEDNIYYGGTSSDTHPTTSTCATCKSLGGGLYTKSVAGSASNECYIQTTAGYYVKESTATAQTACPRNNYCVSEKLTYPNVNTPTACPTPDATTARTTYPESYYENVKRSSIAFASTTKIKSLKTCRATYKYTNNRGTFAVSTYYNPTTGKYDNDVANTQYYTKINAGYYGDIKYYADTKCTPTSTSYMYHRDSKPCPSGSYCPGLTSMPRCNTGTYEDTIGLYDCPDTYPNSADLSSAITQCFVNTTPGNYIAIANEALTSCTSGGYCPGGIQVYYGSTGGRILCESGTVSPDLSTKASQCGRILHIGNNTNDILYLHAKKVTTPSLNVNFDGKTWYANMVENQTKISSDSDRYMQIEYNNKKYYVCDDTICGE